MNLHQFIYLKESIRSYEKIKYKVIHNKKIPILLIPLLHIDINAFNKIKHTAVMRCRVTLKYIVDKISAICLRHRSQFSTSTISSEFYPNAFSVKNERSQMLPQTQVSTEGWYWRHCTEPINRPALRFAFASLFRAICLEFRGIPAQQLKSSRLIP